MKEYIMKNKLNFLLLFCMMLISVVTYAWKHPYIDVEGTISFGKSPDPGFYLVRDKYKIWIEYEFIDTILRDTNYIEVRPKKECNRSFEYARVLRNSKNKLRRISSVYEFNPEGILERFHHEGIDATVDDAAKPNINTQEQSKEPSKQEIKSIQIVEHSKVSDKKYSTIYKEYLTPGIYGGIAAIGIVSIYHLLLATKHPRIIYQV